MIFVTRTQALMWLFYWWIKTFHCQTGQCVLQCVLLFLGGIIYWNVAYETTTFSPYFFFFGDTKSQRNDNKNETECACGGPKQCYWVHEAAKHFDIINWWNALLSEELTCMYFTNFIKLKKKIIYVYCLWKSSRASAHGAVDGFIPQNGSTELFHVSASNPQLV